MSMAEVVAKQALMQEVLTLAGNLALSCRVTGARNNIIETETCEAFFTLGQKLVESGFLVMPLAELALRLDVSRTTVYQMISERMEMVFLRFGECVPRFVVTKGLKLCPGG